MIGKRFHFIVQKTFESQADENVLPMSLYVESPEKIQNFLGMKASNKGKN